MILLSSLLRLGCLNKWENQYRMIIFSGENDSVYKLQLIFEELSKGTIQNVCMNKLDFIIQVHCLELTAIVSQNDSGLKRIDKKNNEYQWILTRETWKHYAELLSVFREGEPGHQYLDCNSDEVVKIMVSSGEYSDDWIGWS